MILFLDTVSTLPEFSLIEDKKIIYSSQILSNQNDKMSDLLIPTYLAIEKKYNLQSNLQLLLINRGPGSYTALRVGIAFFCGLSLSKNINLIGLSCEDLFRFVIPKEELGISIIYITSSNNQNFLGVFDSKKNEFKIQKIDKNIAFDELNIDFSSAKKIFTNGEGIEYSNKLFKNMEILQINFHNIVNNNIKIIERKKKNEIIQPIYFSNNKILN